MLATRPLYLSSRLFDRRAFARNCLKVLLVVVMIGASLFAMPIRSQAGENAHFNVDVEGNGIWGHDWSAGEVQVSITGGSSWTVAVSDGSDGQNPGDFNIDLNNSDPTWDVVPTNEITVAHTTVSSESKTHSATGLTAAYDADSVVSGTAAAGSVVLVWVHGSDAWRNQTATGGNWSANFAVVGDETGEEATIDLGPGNNGAAHQCDGDNDCTFAFWGVPDLPSFSTRIDEGQVHGYQWPLGTDVTLEIDDPDYGSGVDYTETLAPESAPWDPDQTFVQFNTADGGWMLEAGQLVSMSNGDVTKTHTVTDLTILVVDEPSDIVSGTTSSGFGSVNVEIYADGGPGQNVGVVAGAWLADFSGTWDIAPGTNGEANEGDDDGDSTQRSWGVAQLPVFGVDPVHDYIEGWGWQPDVELTITIDGSSFGWNTDGGGNFSIWWDHMPVEISAGDLVEVAETGGGTYKSHTVTGLVVNPPDGPDWVGVGAADMTGTANAAQGIVEVEVHSLGENLPVSFTGSDWVSDPFSRSLGQGDNGVVVQSEPDDGEGLGDQTRIQWQVPQPRFNVGIDEDPQQVWGHGFTPGDTISLTINAVPFGVVSAVDVDPSHGGDFDFDLFDATATVVGAGDVLIIEDQHGNSKTLIVSGLKVGVDEDMDTLSGVATLNAWLWIDVWGVCSFEAQADGSGDWSVSVASECGYDLQPGDVGNVSESDVDGDATSVQWSIAREP
ncbi:MAG: hypothetical protein U9N79_07630, partial [Actinomycetota bacterium]|nr:hypothetical protein [Actinomycetota bacterium]